MTEREKHIAFGIETSAFARTDEGKENMLLLEHHPTTEENSPDSSAMEAFNEEHPEPILPEDLETKSEDTFSDNLIQRTCLQCGFNFFQDKDEILMCLCWNCRKSETEQAETLPIQRIPSLPSVLEVLKGLANS